MQDKIKQIFEDTISVKKKVLDTLSIEIEKSAKIMINALKNGNKILICGNGGSAADSQHFAAELIMTFDGMRKSLPAIALTTDTSAMTAWSNDYGFETLFKRQVEGLGREGDVLVGITTSGNSKNIICAFEAANEKGMKTICLNGKTGGKISDIGVDCNMIVPSDITARIQESHQTIYHAWCKLIDDAHK